MKETEGERETMKLVRHNKKMERSRERLIRKVTLKDTSVLN